MIIGCSSKHSGEGYLPLAAVALSPVIIPIALVRGTAKGVSHLTSNQLKNHHERKLLEQPSPHGLIKILNYYSRSKYKKQAAEKMLVLEQQHKIDLNRMDQVLYLAYSYLILSGYKAKNGLWQTDPDKIDQAWHYMEIYSEQMRTYDEEYKKRQANNQSVDCLCNQYKLEGDDDIFKQLRQALYSITLNNLSVEQRAKAFKSCEQDVPIRKELYIDHGGVDTYLICSSFRNYAIWDTY